LCAVADDRVTVEGARSHKGKRVSNHPSSDLVAVQKEVRGSVDTSPQRVSAFFKMAPGSYGEREQFLGVRTPTLRRIAKSFANLSLKNIEALLESVFNEERLLALFILVCQYKKADLEHKEELYRFYLAHIDRVNNWNLVDASAHLIVGAHVWDKDRAVLERLARSDNLWERRIAIVATWTFIKRGDFQETLKLVSVLLRDTQDLIHKACGWMLREVGQKDVSVLTEFLEKNAAQMPRVMLRYAVEKFSSDARKYHMAKRR
jgi:3-methyladenine DNA glycosylase AlkD